MDDQQAGSWVQMVKKHNTNAQGHLQRENAQLEHAEAPYVQLARYRLAELVCGCLYANQMQKHINDGTIGWHQAYNSGQIVKFRIKWQTLW